MEKVCREMEGW